MNTQNLEEEYHVSRYIIVYKFLLGLFETILGLGMLLFGSKISELYINFTNRELLEEPHELLALILQRIVPFSLNVHPSLSKITFFIINMLIALYLVNFNPKGYFTKLKKRWYTPDHGKK